MGSSQSIQSAAEAVSRWHLEPKERLIFDCGRTEISQYLEAVDKIQQSANNGEFGEIISMAVARLKHEFRTVLTRQTESVIGPSTVTELSSSITDSTSYQFRYEDYIIYEVPSAEVIDYLRNIAERVDSCGYLNACIQVYTAARKHFVNAKIKRLRLEELQEGNKNRFLMEELKLKIQRWIQAAKVCTRILFAKEKQLAMQIFSGLGNSSTHGECFLLTVEDAAVNLFTFAKAVSTSNQSYERLKIILILYEGLSSLMHDVNDLFALESGKRIRDRTAAIVSKLQDEVRRMLSDFENSVLNELSTISDEGGKVHSLSKFVMDYINPIVKYRKVLDFVSKPSLTVGGRRFPNSELQDPQSLTPLGLHLVLIIAVLQLNLETKSKYFKDASLGYLFMINNVHYIVQRIERSKELQEMIGAEYLEKLNENVKQAMSSYQGLACNRFLDCLRDEGLYISRCFSSQVSKSALKKRIKTFNFVYEEISLFQSSWEVTDSRLRNQLCRLMSEKLLPEYEGFLNKFRRHLDSGDQRKRCIHYYQKIHIKYSVKDLEALILNNLFIRSQFSSSSQVSRKGFRLEVLPEVREF